MGAVFKFSSVPAGWPRRQPAPNTSAHAVAARTLRVSVVVPTRGRLPQLMRCLQALLAQNIGRHSFEILVVDEARDKATRRAVQTLARTLPPHLLHYLRPLGSESGAAAARNRGWRAARAPLVAFTAEHALPCPQWLLEGDQAIHSERCIALAGRVVVRRSLDDRSRRFSTPATGEHEPVVLASTNAFVWRKALQSVGGFDGRFRDPAHEDADLQFRLQREGPVGRSERALVVHAAARAGWSEPLRRQRERFFDALLYREHPRQARHHTAAAPPWGSYAVVVLALAALASLLAGSAPAATVFGIGSALGIVSLALRQRRRTAATPGRLFGVLATAALMPFLAVYWRLRGAWHYRVWFV